MKITRDWLEARNACSEEQVETFAVLTTASARDAYEAAAASALWDALQMQERAS